jgi:hypothetical protein
MEGSPIAGFRDWDPQAPPAVAIDDHDLFREGIAQVAAHTLIKHTTADYEAAISGFS